MTRAEIIKGNKIIADFMGDKIGVDSFSWRPGVIVPLEEGHLAYHDQWGWIMPVVLKINQSPEGFHFIIYGAVAEIVDIYPPFETIVKTSVTDKEPKIIEAVWETAVNFIEWYNQQPKTIR